MNMPNNLTRVLLLGLCIAGVMTPIAYADIQQSNRATVTNHIESRGDTGGSRIHGSSDSDISYNSGDINTDIGISNRLNMNWLSSRHWTWDSDEEMEGNVMRGWLRRLHKKYFALLSGEQEVPHEGDPDAYGYAKVRVYPNRESVCIKMQVENIEPATAAHIHYGEMGETGPVVVPLPMPNEDGYVNDCVDADEEVLMAIKDNPSHYYVNVHNEDYPDGALRGQLFR